MSRLIASAALFAAMLVANANLEGQSAPKSQGYSIKLPVPDHVIPCDLSAWKGSFLITKVTYDKDENQVVFLVKTLRAFKFTDDGFTAPLRFVDEDGVNLIKEDKNLKFEGEIAKLNVGEMTRIYLSLPDEETLKKTKSAKAVLKGFFTNRDK